MGMPQILVVRLSSIGDIVHALPAVAALGQHWPNAEISWAIEDRYAELLQDNPFVQRVIALDTLGWRKRRNFSGAGREIARALGDLRRQRPDIAIDFQGLVKSAAIGRLSRAPRRIGFAGPWVRESLAGLFYTEGLTAEGRRHVVEENLTLVEHLGVPPVARGCWQFPLPRSTAVETQVDTRLAALGVQEFLVINPGGGWMNKRWGPEQYAGLIREFGRRHHYDVLVTGSAAEEAMIGSILKTAQSPRSVHFPSTLMEFIALARRARLLVGGDTGPLHLAAAVGTPIVAIYGPTNPERNGPFAPEDITLWNENAASDHQGYAHWGRGHARSQSYLEGISVERVLTAVLDRLASAHGA
jgi:lipopolysaccharide heptosyltransferase I